MVTLPPLLDTSSRLQMAAVSRVQIPSPRGIGCCRLPIAGLGVSPAPLLTTVVVVLYTGNNEARPLCRRHRSAWCWCAVAFGQKRATPPALLWSNPHTWASGHVSRAGDAVVLPEERTVLLDVSPPSLQSIMIGGTYTALVFDDTTDRTLTAGQITVAGASTKLAIGTAEKPFAHQATIRLVANGAETPMLSVSGGGSALELHGETGRTAWTRLSDTAQTLSPLPTRTRAGDPAIRW